MSEPKPDWWPENPYPPDIFTMTDAEYQAALPDHQQRSAISGYLGRLFWNITSESIWDAFKAGGVVALEDVLRAARMEQEGITEQDIAETRPDR